MLKEIQEEPSQIIGGETITKSKIESTTKILNEKVFETTLTKKVALPKTRKMEPF
jgi:hypothetical protein